MYFLSFFLIFIYLGIYNILNVLSSSIHNTRLNLNVGLVVFVEDCPLIYIHLFIGDECCGPFVRQSPAIKV
jgi:hypothetical protein